MAVDGNEGRVAIGYFVVIFDTSRALVLAFL